MGTWRTSVKVQGFAVLGSTVARDGMEKEAVVALLLAAPSRTLWYVNIDLQKTQEVDSWELPAHRRRCQQSSRRNCSGAAGGRWKCQGLLHTMSQPPARPSRTR